MLSIHTRPSQCNGVGPDWGEEPTARTTAAPLATSRSHGWCSGCGLVSQRGGKGSLTCCDDMLDRSLAYKAIWYVVPTLSQLASCSDDGRLMCWRIDRCGRRRLSPPSSPRHVFVDNCSNLDRLFTCHVQEDSLLDQEEIAVEEEEPVEDATGGPRQTGIRDFFRPVSTWNPQFCVS